MLHKYAIARRCQSTSLRCLVPLAALVLGLGSPAAAAQPWTFRLTLEESIRNAPFSGRLYVFFSRQNPEPRLGPDWFNTEPFLSLDVSDLLPGADVELSPTADGVLTWPRDFAAVDLSGYRAQAVARLNPWERTVGDGPGNAYSDVARLSSSPGSVELRINHRVGPDTPEETRWLKPIEAPSALLSEFHHHDMRLRGTVLLPASYFDNPERRYPTIYVIPGFGGTHHDVPRGGPVLEQNREGVEFLRVFLDANCPLGHHVFADSANNGPVGQAFIDEFIPELERRFRAIPQPSARFLTGHSSGGWSSLWLQITDPDRFGGVWSISPDAVDFRDFQRIDIYAEGENMYVDRSGARRPLARMRGRVLLWLDDFAWMEHVLGPGGQMESFEAVFGPRTAEGTPARLWNRETGAIDPAVAKAWEQYDIRLVLERNWPELGPKLAGKLHIDMGTEDTFYLDGAVVLLKDSLAALGSDAVVRMHRGQDHGSILTPALHARIRAEATDAFLNGPSGRDAPPRD